jgi:hypothetical protein
MAGYSHQNLKLLFGLSMNQCAFRDDRDSACEQRLLDVEWDSVKARISHICAARKGGPRYDANMSVKERYSFDNLILLCPTHHVQIDNLEPGRFSVDVLRKMKNDAIERAGSGNTWASDNDALIERGIEVLIVVTVRENSLLPLPPMPMSSPVNLEGKIEIKSTVGGSPGISLEHNITRAQSERSVVDDSVKGPAGGTNATFVAEMGANVLGAQDKSRNDDSAS